MANPVAAAPLLLAAVLQPPNVLNQGEWVESAGDVNGDGYADALLQVGSPWRRAAIYLGGPGGLSVDTAFQVGSPNEDWSSVVAAAGDVDGDGFDDVLILDRDQDELYLWYGSADPAAATDMVRVDVPPPLQGWVVSFDGVGDLNGDGYDDVAIGDPGTVGGRVWILSGSPTGPVLTGAPQLSGDPATDLLGSDVEGAGDTNDDGYDDLLVWDTLGPNGTGAIHWFPGGPAGVDAAAAVTIAGTPTAAWFGKVPRGGADFDGDGFDDTVVTDPGWAELSRLSGSPVGLEPQAQRIVTSDPSRSFDDSELAHADLDGDGRDELVLLEVGDEAVIVVRPGAPGEPDPAADHILAVPFDEEDFPSVTMSVVEGLSGVGDVNGDGAEDVVLAHRSGVLYVYHGICDPDPWYPDTDGDGFGDDVPATTGCPRGGVTAEVAGDCDDLLAAVYPGAEELCDGIDNDCDGVVDPDCAPTEPTTEDPPTTPPSTPVETDEDEEADGGSDLPWPPCGCAHRPAAPWAPWALLRRR